MFRFLYAYPKGSRHFFLNFLKAFVPFSVISYAVAPLRAYFDLVSCSSPLIMPNSDNMPS